MEKDFKPLTKHKEGSLRELFSIAIPLMISAFSTLFMIFVDRIFLANLSINALNAATNAGTLAWAFMGGFGMLTGISQVFVAQNNGAKNYKIIGKYVWQMIWLAIFSLLLFIPLSFIGREFFYSNTSIGLLEKDYFFILILLGPSYLLKMSLAGFFVGRGKTKLLLTLSISANILNIFLDWIFIFGVKGILPPMGIKGAAIATSLGSISEAIILFIIFLHKKNKEKYNTFNNTFDRKLFKKSIKIGAPPALFYGLEIMAWAFFYFMMTRVSEKHITISSLCQSIIILLTFFSEGIYHSVASISGNFIGAKRHHLVKKLIKSAILMQIIFSVITSFFLVVQPMLILKHFSLRNPLLITEFYPSIKICFFFVNIYIFFEGIRWIFSGLLTAAGDSFFILISGIFSVWLFLLLPIYLIVVRHSLSVEIAWILAAIFAFLLTISYLLRFYKGKWKTIELVKDQSLEK